MGCWAAFCRIYNLQTDFHLRNELVKNLDNAYKIEHGHICHEIITLSNPLLFRAIITSQFFILNEKQNLKEGGLSSPLKLWDHEAHSGIRYMIYGFRPMTFQMPKRHSYGILNTQPNHLSISHEAYQINTPKKYQFFYRLALFLFGPFFHLIITKLKYN